MFPRRKATPGSGGQRRCSRRRVKFVEADAGSRFPLTSLRAGSERTSRPVRNDKGFWLAAYGDRVELLGDVEVRVLGALIEKDITTPDYYPLSLNAVVNACNQKNNRDPVMGLDEEA